MKELEKSARRGLERLLVGSGRDLPQPRLDPASLRRIAVLRLDRRLGNQVILFPTVDAIHASLPRAEIEVLAPAPYHAAWEDRPSVTRVVRFERSSPLGAQGLLLLGGLRGRYDLVIEAGHHHRFSTSGALVTRILGAPLNLGFRRGGSQSLLNLPVDVPRAPRGRARLFFELARALDVRAEYSPPRWIVGEGERREAAALRGALGLPGLCVGIHPGGRGVRRWPPEDFRAVARGLGERGIHPVVFLGPAEEPERRAWERDVPGASIVAAPPLRTFAALVSTMSLWVSGDTGPLHVARAAGVPSVGVLLNVEGLEALDPDPRFRALYRPETGPPVAEVLSEALLLAAERDGA